METDAQKRERKREQNRKAQQVSRERHAIRIKELEERIAQLEQAVEPGQGIEFTKLLEENSQLKLTLATFKQSLGTIVRDAQKLLSQNCINTTLPLHPALATPDSATFQHRSLQVLDVSVNDLSRQVDTGNASVQSSECECDQQSLGSQFAPDPVQKRLSTSYRFKKYDYIPVSATFCTETSFDIRTWVAVIDFEYISDPNLRTQETWLFHLEKTFRTAMQTIATAEPPKGWRDRAPDQYKHQIQLCLSDHLAGIWHDLQVSLLEPFASWWLFLNSLGLTEAHVTLMRFRLFPCEENWLSMALKDLR